MFAFTRSSKTTLGIALASMLAVLLITAVMPHKAHAAVVNLVTSTVSSNNASTTLAKVGDTVTFGLTLSATPSATTTPVINIFNMGTTSFSGSATTWSYATTTSAAWTNGPLSFLIGFGGTVGEATTTTSQANLTSANVRFDKSVPTISSITSVAACTGVNSTCKAGDTITFTLTPGATEYGASVSGSYNGIGLNWSTSNSGATYTAVYTVAKGQHSDTAPIQISGVVITDAAGNASTAGAGSDVAVSITVPTHSSPTVVTGSSGGSSSSSSSSSSNTTTTTTTTKPTTPASPEAIAHASPMASFLRDLQVGVAGDDVKALQMFLNAHGFVLAITGPGSKGSETSTFGGLTRAALAKFQAANGITPSVGYFGPKTRAFIAGMK